MPLTPDTIRQRVAAYYAAIRTGDVDAIVALFAADGAMRDPVGAPAATTDAGRRQIFGGIKAVFASFGLQEEHVSANPPEAAARWTARGTTHAGKEISFEGISTFVFDADGKIAAMSAYWEPAILGAKLAG